jgi:ABC-2 type transport system ATP-binding protein
VKDFRILKRGDTGLRRFYSLIKPDYITKRVIDIPHLDIEAGEVVGYVGANGAGKSTTIKMLSGILTPTSGTIEVAGLIPWKHQRQNAFHIGVVFGQRSHLWWDLPLIESFKLIAKIYTLSQQRYQQNLDRFVAMLDMASFLETPVRQLSLGQRMRGDLVAAMLYEPPILFLDEPTIGLDVLAKESIRCFIEEVNRLKQTTVMLTTHDLSDVERLCSRIVLIDEGHIIYDGAIADLKSRYTKKRQFAVQLEDPTAPVDIVGATVIDRQNTRVFFEYDPATTAIPTLISAINQSHQIIDLSITEPDLESIIRQIYRKNDHHEELDYN